MQSSKDHWEINIIAFLIVSTSLCYEIILCQRVFRLFEWHIRNYTPWELPFCSSMKAQTYFCPYFYISHSQWKCQCSSCILSTLELLMRNVRNATYYNTCKCLVLIQNNRNRKNIAWQFTCTWHAALYSWNSVCILLWQRVVISFNPYISFHMTCSDGEVI